MVHQLVLFDREVTVDRQRPIHFVDEKVLGVCDLSQQRGQSAAEEKSEGPYRESVAARGSPGCRRC